jgi:hypothetical protein
MQYSPEASEDIFAAIADGAQNPYRAFLEAYVTGHLRREAPDVIGISLAAPSQVIPGLSLASLIRLKMPGTKIVVGGMIPSLLAEKIRDVPRLFTLFDYLIKFEGETPLLRLCQHLEGECAVTQVPNLLYLDKGEVKDTGLNSFEDVNELPTPIYDGLPLDRYLSPVPVLSLEPARGCYWRQCGFCSQHTVHGNTFRIRRPEKTAADMARLQERYGTSLFNVVNEGLAAKHLSLLAKAILERGLHVHWYAGARFEKRLTRERLEVIGRSGCRKLLFGLESGSQRVLDLMEKGIRLEDVPGILTACKDAGVDVHLYLMIGFPTESERERKQTQDFVEGHLDALACDWFTFNVGVFRAEIGAPILEQLPRLGYRLVAKGRKFDLEFLFEHEPADATVPRVSREQREHMANQMVASICKHLPPQRVPEEVTHYMCYRVLRHGKPMPSAVGRPDTKGDTDALSRNGHRLCVSPWVTIRRLRTMDGDAKQPAEVSVRLVSQYVAYNLRLDRCYGLNRTAVELLERLRHPKTFDDILRRRQPRSVEARRLRECIADLLNRGLIEVEEVNCEAQERFVAANWGRGSSCGGAAEGQAFS